MGGGGPSPALCPRFVMSNMSNGTNSTSAQLHVVDDTASGDTVTGICISFLSAFLYAVGLCVQRAALSNSDETTTAAPGCSGACCKTKAGSTLNWLIGLLIYGIGGLGLGTVALSYISLVRHLREGRLPTHDGSERSHGPPLTPPPPPSPFPAGHHVVVVFIHDGVQRRHRLLLAGRARGRSRARPPHPSTRPALPPCRRILLETARGARGHFRAEPVEELVQQPLRQPWAVWIDCVAPRKAGGDARAVHLRVAADRICMRRGRRIAFATC